MRPLHGTSRPTAGADGIDWRRMLLALAAVALTGCVQGSGGLTAPSPAASAPVSPPFSADDIHIEGQFIGFGTLQGIEVSLRLSVGMGSALQPVGTCEVDFGDGSPIARGVFLGTSIGDLVVDQATFECAASHTYAQPGAYLLRFAAVFNGRAGTVERSLPVAGLSGTWLGKRPGDTEPSIMLELEQQATALTGRGVDNGERFTISSGSAYFKLYEAASGGPFWADLTYETRSGRRGFRLETYPPFDAMSDWGVVSFTRQ